jgi:hypothetical protein
MTFFEHAMLGGTLTLAAGLHRRHGWQIAAMAGVAAMLPDWDGLTLVFGVAAYDRTHRIWGHNVFAATAIGGLCGLVAVVANGTNRVQHSLNRLAPTLVPAATDSPRAAPPRSVATLAVWILVGAVASLSHLAVDMLYSSHPRMQDWPIQLLWPISRRSFAYPIVHWGDVGATIVFVGRCSPSTAGRDVPKRLRGSRWSRSRLTFAPAAGNTAAGQAT